MMFASHENFVTVGGSQIFYKVQDFSMIAFSAFQYLKIEKIIELYDTFQTIREDPITEVFF